jgi:hypothetical protein
MSQENNITEWMTPIAEEAKPIFAEFSQETAIEIAAGVLKGEDTDEKTIIPWATVFTSDDKQWIGARLLGVLQTPDYQTPVFDPDTRGAVKELGSLIDKSRAAGIQRKLLAHHLVRTAAGKEDEHFVTYPDMGRKWPQEATDWFERLNTQFGLNGLKEIIYAHPDFAILLGGTATIAELHYQRKGRISLAGESSFDVISRTKEMFDLSSIEGLKEASRILGQGFEEYRRAAYLVRGLELPADS